MSNHFLSPAFPAEKKVYLETHKIKGVELEICPASGGIWFDRFEIKKFDESHECLKEILAVLPKNPKPAEVLHGRRSPKHPEAIMQQYPYGPKGAKGILTIDSCPISAGIWLDFNELQKIHELYPTEAEMKNLTEAFVNNAFKGFSKK